MTINGVTVRVNKFPDGTEVFIQCADPVVNTVLHLAADADVESGSYDLTLTKAAEKGKKKAEA